MSSARRASLSRRLRSAGGFVMRRAGLLPSGVPDGLGQDAELVDARIPHTVMVFFADTSDSLYQIEQWYEPFRLLDKRHRVVVVLKDSRVAKRVRADSGLDTLVVSHYTTMDGLLSRSNVKVALYVNHNPENFANLRFRSLVHASLMHGDSDKGVTVSNQTKAYDFSLVAGQAAVERMAAFSTFYDAHARCIPIGRPQIDEQAALRVSVAASSATDGGIPVVLYAPTWEGPQPSAAYGSTRSHGPALVESFLQAGWRVIYRPHPLSGVRDPDYGEVDHQIRRRLLEAEQDSRVRHRTDTANDPAQAFAEAQIMICDVSGVAMDWLPSGKPLIITSPKAPEVSVARSPLLDLVPSLRTDDVAEVAQLALFHLAEDPLASQRQDLVEYYLGSLTPGAAMGRFFDAVDHMVQLHDTVLPPVEVS